MTKPIMPKSWAYSFSDYIKMFNLSTEELLQPILECGSGPSAFCAEQAANGHKVVACDSLYRLPKDKLTLEIEYARQAILESMTVSPELYVISEGARENYAKASQANSQQFLDDFQKGVKEGRYLDRSLAELGYGPGSFQVVLCLHSLFANIEGEPILFTTNAIKALASVGEELRVFPLLDAHGSVSTLVGPTMQALQKDGYQCEIIEVDFELQKGANALLSVKASGASAVDMTQVSIDF